jgi:6-phosphogluconolactonase (cycloisomerase 2 family)
MRGLLVAGCVTLAACTGGGKDRSFDLPAGEEFDGARSARVLVVVEAQNECGDHGACVTPPPGPCHLGDGNTRGLSVYRLGTSGLLLGNSPEGAVPEQIIALDDNPRRVVVNPRNPSILYVSTEERVQVVRLQAGGGSACIDETAREQDVRPDADDMDPVDMVVDPTIGNGILYVATRGSNRVDAYPLAEDGTLDSLPQSCIVGGGGTDFSALTPLGEGFFAAGGSSRIEIHARLQGQFLPEPDPNATRTATPVPAVSPTPAPDETPGPTSPSPQRSTCFDARLVTTPLSVIGAALVNQLAFEPSASAPLGQLFIAEEVSERIFTFPVNADGIIADNDSSSTKRAGVYQRMLRHRHLGQDILYASVYNEGRVDAFQMENGLLPNESFSRTAQDPNALPVGLVIDDPNGTILYVAQGGLDRVDGFRIRDDGGLPDEPVTSTAPPVDESGQSITSFPDDLVIVPLP